MVVRSFLSYVTLFYLVGIAMTISCQNFSYAIIPCNFIGLQDKNNFKTQTYDVLVLLIGNFMNRRDIKAFKPQRKFRTFLELVQKVKCLFIS